MLYHLFSCDDASTPAPGRCRSGPFVDPGPPRRGPIRSRLMKRLVATVATSFALCLPLLAAAPARAAASQTIQVVAAENFYGELVQALGGPHVSVTSILSNPDQDPHLFEASPKTARALASAQLVVYNGANYDPWLPKLLAGSRAKRQARTEIVVAELVGKKPGDNPHLWYLPATMPAVARAISAFLVQADPAHQADYAIRLTQFIDSLKPIDEKIAALKQRYQGAPVTATEPVFGYMAEAIGLTMRNERFQLAAMNETEPSAADVAAFERDLRTQQVKVLIYNSQASDTSTQRMLKIAQQSHVPTVHVTETEPDGKTYRQWMLEQLDALEKALQGQAQ
ncbi:metal ABC transporter solute-binding protein [Mycetohabitans endofungorum]|uniref:metal ABC transporter solute-binding protein n=1 Tax=Mycetohabitans endofungorum TaxID=417203 RepID=UPI00396A375F